MFKRIANLFKSITVDIYRCYYCGNILTDWQIKKGILCNCGTRKVVATNPTLKEKIRIIVRYILKGY